MKDITGQRFGSLVAVRQHGRDPWGQLLWLCSCDCGQDHVATGGNLRSGTTKSCGCRRVEVGKAKRTHGGSRTRMYGIWASMIRRCEVQHDQEYENYGARGIRVCERWRLDYAAWLSDMGSRPSPQHSIDRIDVNGHYEPSNCRWATTTEQARNKRSNVVITFNGETLCIADWSLRTGIKATTLYKRVHAGWPVEAILGSPLQHGVALHLRTTRSTP